MDMAKKRNPAPVGNRKSSRPALTTLLICPIVCLLNEQEYKLANYFYTKAFCSPNALLYNGLLLCFFSKKTCRPLFRNLLCPCHGTVSTNNAAAATAMAMHVHFTCRPIPGVQIVFVNFASNIIF
jgi:hypothetical protein